MNTFLVFLDTIVGGVDRVPTRPGAVETNIVTWFTVAGYFLAGCLCIRTAVHVHRSASETFRTRHIVFWSILAGLALVLGLNREFGLLGTLTQFGRQLALSDKWYEYRRILQVMLIVVFGVAGLSVSGICCWLIRDSLRRHISPLLGVTFVLGLVLLRTPSLHEIDRLLYRGPAGFRMNWALELIGVVWVAISAFRAGRLAKQAPDAIPVQRKRVRIGD